MADVVHHDTGSGAGFLMGAALLIIALVLFMVFGLPLIRGEGGGSDINIEVPTPTNTTGGY